MSNVQAIIMAGGAGTRLSVLSEERSKPAVPFAARYRIIDFTISNCVNSDIYNIAVLTQYRPRSLNDHIGVGKPWDLDRARGGIRLLQPYQARGRELWYGGTADAVYQNLDDVREQRADYVIILSGDHIYKMDYRPMLKFHQEKDADLTVAVMNVPLDETDRFGIMSVNDDLKINAFYEKPKKRDKGTLASMGIYIFNTQNLAAQLEIESKSHTDLDFGKHVIPHMIETGRVFAIRSRAIGWMWARFNRIGKPISHFSHPRRRSICMTPTGLFTPRAPSVRPSRWGCKDRFTPAWWRTAPTFAGAWKIPSCRRACMYPKAR